MVAISSAEFQRKFGRYKEVAQREPVSITSYGRESLVMLSAAEYRRLKALDTRVAQYAWEIPEGEIEALAATEPPEETTAFDHEDGAGR